MSRPPLATMKARVERAFDELHRAADEMVVALEDLPNRNDTQENALHYAREARALAETCIG